MLCVALEHLLVSYTSDSELIMPQYFSQFITYENLELPTKYYCCTIEVEAVSVEPTIDTVKLVDTIRGESLEGQRLSGRKLVLTGRYNIKVILSYCCKLEVFKQTLPFSTCIVVPHCICTNEKIVIKYLVEDITTEIINKKKLFVSISSVFAYCDHNL